MAGCSTTLNAQAHSFPPSADIALYLVTSSTTCLQIVANNTQCFQEFQAVHGHQLDCYHTGHCPTTIHVVESITFGICPQMLWIRYSFGLV